MHYFLMALYIFLEAYKLLKTDETGTDLFAASWKTIVSTLEKVIGRSLAPHHQGLGPWIVACLTGKISSFFYNFA